MFLHCQRRDVVGCWCELRFLLGGGHKVGESPCGEVWQGVAEEVMTEVSSRGLVDSFFVGEKRQWGAGEGLLHWVGVLEVDSVSRKKVLSEWVLLFPFRCISVRGGM